ncbi:hypothetical protein NX059_007395 [Plenodomus lindquistii]|nr:hypothetical protein NX059_007395 [Plenodomus lindquistii]
MRSSQFMLLGLCAAANATLLSSEDTLFASLLKRQEPGTPAYNCHDNCGTAITVSKPPASPPCSDPSFLSNYANCLQCSGPDNYNIWRYYGRSLSVAGAACGLETEPKSGKQDDVGPAAQAAGSSATSAAAAPTTTSVSVGVSETASAAATAPISTSAAAEEVASSSAAAQTSALVSGSGSVVPSQTVNGTASSTAVSFVFFSTYEISTD